MAGNPLLNSMTKNVTQGDSRFGRFGAQPQQTSQQAQYGQQQTHGQYGQQYDQQGLRSEHLWPAPVWSAGTVRPAVR